ncbi:heparinase II/III family protein [Desulfosporosinus meridiei]|uniref:heparinase II/III family protein n=1 Tax=Desulfosporosinus meridiei TaxID=79209 RepID=UPI0002E124F6|nr:heparinase II/III family protein [Desulfosporosinus meridiei]
MKNRILLYLHTVRHYKASQIYFRIKLLIKRNIYYRIFDPSKRCQNLLLNHRFNEAIVEKNIKKCSIKVDKEIKDKDLYQKIVTTAEEIIENRVFKFLNHKVRFSNKINWTNAYPSTLWGYNLNYFDFLLPISIYINVEKDMVKWEKLKSILGDWIEAYDYKHKVIASPYVVSLRLVNFLFMILLTNNCMKAPFNSASSLMTYLYRDFFYLSENLELDIKGNHLLKNLKALIVLGFFFKTKKSIQIAQESVSKLLEELEEQILEDGGHFERSPMYQAIVTQDMIEIIYFMRLLDIPVPKELIEKLGLMLDFLEVMTHPDGDISLFNDSAFNIAAESSDILFVGARLLNKTPSIYARPGRISYLLSNPTKNMNYLSELRHGGLAARPDTGYFCLNNNFGKMILDCGDLAPDYLPAHAHNDMLSFELSLKDKRYLVDTGVYEYQPGIFRDNCRSTFSHNTVAINGKEQSELWASFRMARRGKIKSCGWKEGNEYCIVSAERSQYDSKDSLHRRTVIGHQDGFWVILDRVQGEEEGEGDGLHLSHLHFHPDLDPVLTPTGIIADQLVIQPFAIDAGFKLDILKSLYFPEFGLKQERSTLRMGTSALYFGYVLIAYQVECFKIAQEQGSIHLSLDKKNYYLDMDIS